MKFKVNYGERKKQTFNCEGKSSTKQSFKEECDVNNILRKFNLTGQLPDMILKNPQYGDFSSVPDYQTSLEVVKMAQEQFMGLSARVRDRFNNDPAKFLDFATNPENRDEMKSLGLLKPEEKPPVIDMPKPEVKSELD